MKILITLGATREPIDAVRFVGNRSSGRMGAALVSAGLGRGHAVTVIAGAISAELPALAALAPPNRRIDVETARQMHDAVLAEFPSHDVLIMAAAVADYRPVRTEAGKLPRSGGLTIAFEPTEDILLAVSAIKQPGQRVVGFSLEQAGDLDRARQKLIAKKLDLMVFNPLASMGSAEIEATLLWPNGQAEPLGRLGKSEMARTLVEKAEGLVGHS
jgi:phosphopantothenoylcysteine decarboxylase/phosphopantothenate--cysteine ligase